jgi:hypothetical protein
VCLAESWVDEAVGDGAVVDRAGCGDQVFRSMPALAGVAPDDCGGGAGAVECFDVAGGDVVESPVAPHVRHAVPVGAVGAAGTWAGCRILPSRRDWPSLFGAMALRIFVTYHGVIRLVSTADADLDALVPAKLSMIAHVRLPEVGNNADK